MADLPIGAQIQQYPIDQMLVSLAKGLVKAQWELNQTAIEALKLAATEKIQITGVVDATLLELGLVPAFYRFETLTIDLSIEMSMFQEEESSLALNANINIGQEAAAEEAETEEADEEASEENEPAAADEGDEAAAEPEPESDSGSGGSAVSFGASIDVATSRKYGVSATAGTHLSATISAVDPPKALLRALGLTEDN